MNKRVFLFAAAIVLLSGARADAASFQVSPVRFEFPLDASFTNFFTVTNNSDKALRVRVYPKFVQIDENGVMVETAESPFDLSSWVVINPRFVSLGPLEKRVVRFSVRAPEKPPAPGEYRAVVFFEELPNPPDPAAPDTGKGTTIRLDLLTRLGATLYGMAGEPKLAVTAELGSTEFADGHWVHSVVLVNRGNAHVVLDAEANLLGADGKALRTWKDLIALQRDQRRVLKLDWQIPPPGSYSLVLVATGKGIAPVEARLPVKVAPTPGK
jgi:P pilus assembly chaperone PapD